MGSPSPSTGLSWWLPSSAPASWDDLTSPRGTRQAWKRKKSGSVRVPSRKESRAPFGSVPGEESGRRRGRSQGEEGPWAPRGRVPSEGRVPGEEVPGAAFGSVPGEESRAPSGPSQERSPGRRRSVPGEESRAPSGPSQERIRAPSGSVPGERMPRKAPGGRPRFRRASGHVRRRGVPAPVGSVPGEESRRRSVSVPSRGVPGAVEGPEAAASRRPPPKEIREALGRKEASAGGSCSSCRDSLDITPADL
nr:collagen alpha-1(I) chain-like [Penaeus vannamei]